MGVTKVIMNVNDGIRYLHVSMDRTSNMSNIRATCERENILHGILERIKTWLSDDEAKKRIKEWIEVAKKLTISEINKS